MAYGPNTAHSLFVNKIVLEFRHTHLYIDCLWLLSYYNALSDHCDRDPMARRVQNLYYLAVP